MSRRVLVVVWTLVGSTVVTLALFAATLAVDLTGQAAFEAGRYAESGNLTVVLEWLQRLTASSFMAGALVVPIVAFLALRSKRHA